VTDSSSHTITITWKKNTEADFQRYRIYGGTSSNPVMQIDSTTGGVGDTTKTFNGLCRRNKILLRAAAVDSAGNESVYSNEVNAVPADRNYSAPQS